jgi:ABC-type uncharacterized transport system substrate-binding protein
MMLSPKAGTFMTTSTLRGIAGALALCLAGHVSGAVVVRKPGALTPLSDALIEQLRKSPVDGAGRVVDLSGDSAADAARVARECGGAGVIFTIGPEAAGAVSAVSTKSAVVALGVPNPARVGVSATYLSVYPRLESVLDFAAAKLNAKRVGLLHSPAQNAEIVVAFQKAAAQRGMTIVPLAVGSSGELVRVLGGIAAQVDAVMLAIDPLVFDRQALRFVVEKATAAKKPTVGFITDLAGLGVTVALTNDPAAIATAAVNAARTTARPGARGTAHADGMIVTASRRSAEMIGISLESLGAHQTR